jgi:hypothetical protein
MTGDKKHIKPIFCVASLLGRNFHFIYLKKGKQKEILVRYVTGTSPQAKGGTNFAFVPIVTMKPRREVGIHKHCRTNKCAMICQEQYAKEQIFVS